MTAFVIMAAGEGSRVGRAGGKLHKALLPLGGRAVLSHLIDLAPNDARIIICVGDRGQQIHEYVMAAHMSHNIEFVEVDIKKDKRGPGATLLAARDAVGADELILTTCDTLWGRDLRLWDGDHSWAAVAPTPAGTPPERWCRIEKTSDNYAARLRDKTEGGPRNWAYTGLARVAQDDLLAFWDGIERSTAVGGEQQVTGGLAALVNEDRLRTRRISWTDVGDDHAYRAAVAQHDGYDFTKLAEATYVLPEEGRVVKWWEDSLIAGRRRKRAELLRGAVPQLLGGENGILAYEYVPAVTGYEAADQSSVGVAVTGQLLRWAEQKLWTSVPHTRAMVPTCLRFYHDKTMRRISMLPRALQGIAYDAVRDVKWTSLAEDCVPRRIHGDFNLGNVLVPRTGGEPFVTVDWREDFGGALEWGDKRWDLGKLLAGTVVHWDRARRGDFRVWDEGEKHADVIRNFTNGDRGVETIGALSLINSAPLHADPLPEILVARATAWLEVL